LINLGEEILKQRPEKTDIAVIMYTSGSTGTPKGYFLYPIDYIFDKVYRIGF
jgi:long-subunit acyl-CoA synthetase (AMP-forming)